MSEVRIATEPRAEFGKGAARRTRRAGRVPAVLYGHGQPPRHLSLPGHDLMLALKGGANTLLRLDLEGGSELVLPRAVVRDPIKGSLQHLDLLLVRLGEQVSVSVPVTLTGEAALDTLVDLQMTSLPVLAEATHIPTELLVSVAGLAPGDAVTAGQVTLPTGVTLAGDPEQVVVHVMASPTAEQMGEAVAPAAEAEPAVADPA
ncbi:MAG: 50S ribosomal protein L25/general stress protein Ctc [Mycobacteriales bacterium]